MTKKYLRENFSAIGPFCQPKAGGKMQARNFYLSIAWIKQKKSLLLFLFAFGSMLLILGFYFYKTAKKCPDDIFSFRKPWMAYRKRRVTYTLLKYKNLRIQLHTYNRK